MDATDRKRRAGAEAAKWFALLQSDHMQRDEREQFIDWLRESQLHVAELLRIFEVHGVLEQFDRWTDLATDLKTDDDSVVHLNPRSDQALTRSLPRDTKRHPLGQSLGAVLAMAAVVLITLATVLVLPRIRDRVIDTERGERREVVLNDGSVLQVDPETQLRVKYTQQLRTVYLMRGRALFHVARNAQRPFWVQAGGTTVRAVGTAFGVERQMQGVVVTVAEGKVAIDNHPNSSSDHPSTSSDGMTRSRVGTSAAGEVFLTANQQVMVPASGSASPVHAVDSHRELAWAEGRLIFQEDSLSTAVEEFNRYNRIQIAIADATLAAHPVTGVFNAAQPESFIAFLQNVAPVEIVRDGDRSITIRSQHPATQ